MTNNFIYFRTNYLALYVCLLVIAAFTFVPALIT